MYNSVNGTVIGSVVGTQTNYVNPGLVNDNTPVTRSHNNKITPASKPREVDMPRGLNYYADFSGCGFWRMLWPEHTLNAYQKAIVHGSTVMVTDEKYYTNVKTVRIQRQATPAQRDFVKYLKKLGDKMGFSVVYEIDDVVFYEDIPEYNKFRGAFVDDKIRKATTEMMTMCDEITVTCDYMKDYYAEQTGNDNITVIPNYPPRYWLDQYNESMIDNNFSKRKKKPRVLYAGSGAHFDVDNVVGQQDDFGHVVDTVIKTASKYHWIFIGAYPMKLHELVKAGKVEFHPWTTLYEYPRLVQKVRANIMVAPLQDNIFNRCKSDLKYIEGCALGIPTICQDMCTYENAIYKFKTGDEMVDHIDNLMSDKQRYMKAVRRGREVINKRWLENPENLGKYHELYTLPYGSSERKYLL
jgi:O-antigen biosynthesis protein